MSFTIQFRVWQLIKPRHWWCTLFGHLDVFRCCECHRRSTLDATTVNSAGWSKNRGYPMFEMGKSMIIHDNPLQKMVFPIFRQTRVDYFQTSETSKQLTLRDYFCARTLRKFAKKVAKVGVLGFGGAPMVQNWTGDHFVSGCEKLLFPRPHLSFSRALSEAKNQFVRHRERDGLSSLLKRGA